MSFDGTQPLVILIVVTLSATGLFSIGTALDRDPGSIYHPGSVMRNSDGLILTAIVRDGKYHFPESGRWTPQMIKGVNIGFAKPGHGPNECAITLEEYVRWLALISDMNANTVRLLDLHPPQFYEALYRHNSGYDDPLRLIQGVTLSGVEGSDPGAFFSEGSMVNCTREVRLALDAVHGSSQGYRYDVSEHLAGLIIGQEWEGALVSSVDISYPELADLEGRFVRTEGGSPFEIWLATIMEDAAEYQASTYGALTPLSFMNVPWLDVLDHPGEPDPSMDMAELDPDHITSTERLGTDLFASYNIYPYYPDFMNLEERYVSYVDDQGQRNNFAGYLHDLIGVHETPVLVSEFGASSSRGCAHKGIHGIDHGGMSETEQGSANARMFTSIRDEGTLGGILFSWHDEWFKTTWNTIDCRDVSSLALWHDVQSPESSFGLLCFDPADGIVLDGERSDWEGKGTVFSMSAGPIEKVLVHQDERYLHLGLVLTEPFSDPTDLEKAMIALDILPRMGSPNSEDTMGIPVGSDLYLVMGRETRLMRDGSLDPSGGESADVADMVPIIQYLGSSSDQGHYDAGLLHWGIGDPDDPSFDSISDICAIPGESCVEIRLAWGLSGFSDPSSREVCLPADGGAVIVDGIGIALMVPGTSSGFEVYPLDPWEIPSTQERLKASYHIMTEALAST